MKSFSEQLLNWYKANARHLPWRETKDPYKIWISEIILQQTRVEQGKNYYLNFIKLFPTVKHLAKAPSDKVMKAWEGLGYYSRARNLHAAAKTIAEDYKGLFPEVFEEILSLKGVGNYTASAIASIAFNQKKAVVDGNVYRVLSRIYGIADPIDSFRGKKVFQLLADKLLSQKRPGDYNQALMEFGATHCTPKKPKCSTCIFSEDCIAFREQKVSAYPVKEKKIKINQRHLNYTLFIFKNNILIRRREDKDIWKNLYEFFLYSTEADKRISEEVLSPDSKLFPLFNKIISIDVSETIKHQLSHQTIFCKISTIRLKSKPAFKGYKWVQISNLNTYAFPRLLDRFLTREGFLLPKKSVNLKRKTKIK